MQSRLMEILQFNKQRIELMRKERERLADGSLVINHRDNSDVYYEVHDGKRKGITRDEERVYALARAGYIDRYLEILRDEQRTMRNCLAKRKKSVNKYLDRFEKTELDVARIVLSRKQYQWRNHQSDNGEYYPENLKYKTDRGIYMRSRSEMLIGNILDDYHIPYRYECAVEIDVTALVNASGELELKGTYARNGRYYKVYYPDFVILLADGSYIFWEHLGLISSVKYREDNSEKMIAYLSCGVIDLNHLILTFPSDVDDPNIVRNIIKDKIRPYI